MAVLGCIADDFTGASDAASFLVKGGMRVKLYNGVPKENTGTDDAQAIVIALKSRTSNKEQAVACSLQAADFLKAQGVQQIYFKYCSTFDSTPDGNIGPVADALMEHLNVSCSLLCPSLPINGRTVSNGKLYVNGVPLSESHMKDHPLNPMWDSHIAELMRPQSKYSCEVLRQSQMTDSQLQALFHRHTDPFYIVPDYETEADGQMICEFFGKMPFLTGGSDLLAHLAEKWSKTTDCSGTIPESAVSGQALLIAGSCSKATLEQIEHYKSQGFPTIKLDPFLMMNGQQILDEVWDFIEKNTTEDKAVLLYSSDTPEMVSKYQSLGSERVAELLENSAAFLAKRAVEHGFTRIISAGGETSGAVTKGLGFSSYWIGESVAPGVPIMVPSDHPGIRLILKSGNFGQQDFFTRALTMTHRR